MKRCGLVILFCLPLLVNAQVITTIAGNGTGANTGDSGLATSAEIYYPIGGVFDKQGNYYFALGDENKVRKISSDGIIYTIAGNGSGGDGGPAYSAQLNDVQAVTVDTAGNVFLAETGENRIRKIDIGTGIISTITGNGTAGFSGDSGSAAVALLNYPLDLSFDQSGNLYIADAGNDRVRKINTSGIITTYAGNGGGVYNGEGIPATSQGIGGIQGLCLDGIGNVYLAANGRVYKINTAGIIYNFAGNGSPAYSGNGGLAINAEVDAEKVTFDHFGNLYIAEPGDNTVRVINSSGIINPIAGNQVPGYNGDGISSITAEVNNPAGVVTDSCGNLYIADALNYRIRKVTFPKCGYEGVQNISATKTITIYPNPTCNNLIITTTQKINTITIYNLIGQAVYCKGYSNEKAAASPSLSKGEETQSIDISFLPAGVYMVTITDNEGNKTVKKIVKE